MQQNQIHTESENNGEEQESWVDVYCHTKTPSSPHQQEMQRQNPLRPVLRVVGVPASPPHHEPRPIDSTRRVVGSRSPTPKSCRNLADDENYILSLQGRVEAIDGSLRVGFLMECHTGKGRGEEVVAVRKKDAAVNVRAAMSVLSGIVWFLHVRCTFDSISGAQWIDVANSCIVISHSAFKAIECPSCCQR